MHDFRWPALITLAVLVLHFALAWNVAKARIRYGIKVPAMSGNADFERVLRVQMNTVESTLIFLPALWLFAAFVSEPWAAAVGAAWLAARIWYAIAYQQSADQRGPPFIVSMLLFWGLVAGTAWKVIASFA